MRHGSASSSRSKRSQTVAATYAALLVRCGVAPRTAQIVVARCERLTRMFGCKRSRNTDFFRSNGQFPDWRHAVASLNERIVGVVFFALSGYAFADGLVISSPIEMTVANIEPIPMELVPPIPEPLRYWHRNEMEFQASQGAPFYGQIEGFYSAQVMHEFQIGTGKGIPMPEPAPAQVSNFLHPGQSTAPILSIVELPNPTLTLRAQPQRKLSLTVDDWVFSGTARVAALGAHSTSATLSVRHGF